jgi:hypothetical protein
VIQDGSELTADLKTALGSSIAKVAGGATVTSVTVEPSAQCQQNLLPAPCALVDYSIVGTTGSVVEPGLTAYAIDHEGTWLVAKSSICGLLSLFQSVASSGAKITNC